MVWSVGANEPAGKWTLALRSQLDGMTASLPVTMRAGGAMSPVAVDTPVIARGTREIEALLARKSEIVIPVFDGACKSDVLVAAQAARQALTARGIMVELRENPTTNTYVMGYDPDAAQLAENARAERGETLGVIKRTTTAGDYFEDSGRYIFGKSVILFDLPAPKDPADPTGRKMQPVNPMATALDRLGALWPAVSEVFPGPGRATVQIVRNAFGLGADAIVVQSADAAGLLAGARALAKLPEDWITPGIEGARTTLLTQFGIGVRPTQVSTDGLTGKGLEFGRAPQPLAIRFLDQKPPHLANVKPWTRAEIPVVAIPAVIEETKCPVFYRMGSEFVECQHILPGDARFYDALLIKVDQTEAGPCTIAVNGLFRYSDRNPWTQGVWEDLLALHNRLPRPRLPMTVDVYVDGKLAGSLGTLDISEQKVAVRRNPAESVTEEAVTQIRGTVMLPIGVHDIHLLRKNMVDGKIKTIAFSR